MIGTRRCKGYNTLEFRVIFYFTSSLKVMQTYKI
uniref:Uncharacterized protein n=1 Tax=Anguilla anguilla TaxID=7936 RepID=A0A0E9Q408_ANGAN